MTQNLSFLKINETWLLNEIDKNDIHTVKDVLLASYDTNGILHIDMKSHDHH